MEISFWPFKICNMENIFASNKCFLYTRRKCFLLSQHGQSAGSDRFLFYSSTCYNNNNKKKKYKKNPYFMKFTKSRIIYFPVLSSGTENTSKLDSQHLIKSTLKWCDFVSTSCGNTREIPSLYPFYLSLSSINITLAWNLS